MPCGKRGLISYLCTVLPVEFHGGAPPFLLFEDWESTKQQVCGGRLFHHQLQ